MKMKRPDYLLYITIVVVAAYIGYSYLSPKIATSRESLGVEVSLDDPGVSLSRNAKVSFGATTLRVVKNLRATISITNLPGSASTFSNIRITSASPTTLFNACNSRVVFRTNAVGGWSSPTNYWIAYDKNGDGVLDKLGYSYTITGPNSCGLGWTANILDFKTPAGTGGTYDIYNSTTGQIGICKSSTEFLVFCENCGSQYSFSVTTPKPVAPYSTNNQEATKMERIASLPLNSVKTITCDIPETALNTLIGQGLMRWGVTIVAFNDNLQLDADPYVSESLDVTVAQDEGGYAVGIGVTKPVVSFRSNRADGTYRDSSGQIAVDYNADGALECFTYYSYISTSMYSEQYPVIIGYTPLGREVRKYSTNRILTYFPESNTYPIYQPGTCTIPLLTYPQEPYNSEGKETQSSG